MKYKDDMFGPDKIMSLYNNNADFFLLPFTDPAAYEQLLKENNVLKKIALEFSEAFSTCVHNAFLDSHNAAETYSPPNQFRLEKVITRLKKAYTDAVLAIKNNPRELQAFLTNNPALAEFLYNNRAQLSQLAKSYKENQPNTVVSVKQPFTQFATKPSIEPDSPEYKKFIKEVAKDKTGKWIDKYPPIKELLILILATESAISLPLFKGALKNAAIDIVKHCENGNVEKTSMKIVKECRKNISEYAGLFDAAYPKKEESKQKFEQLEKLINEINALPKSTRKLKT